jgi:hypothetical protein
VERQKKLFGEKYASSNNTYRLLGTYLNANKTVDVRDRHQNRTHYDFSAVNDYGAGDAEPGVVVSGAQDEG